MGFSAAFEISFHQTMLWEVGPHWNPNDPDVIAGNYATPNQRRKVGYVNHPNDPGGETKYGIAQHKNQDIVVADLDLAMAMQLYHDRYWLPAGCEQLLYPYSALHFDCAVHHGPVRSIMFLQRALALGEDGKFGKMTQAAAVAINQETLIKKVSNIRAEYFVGLVKTNHKLEVFLKGWMSRVNGVTNFCLAALKLI
jgi:lysozyme family protein